MTPRPPTPALPIARCALALLHGGVAFLFNTVIAALTIGTIGSLLD